MHLQSLQVERYKGYLEPCKLCVRPLTILVGRNSSGKSALARAIPLLAGGLLGNRHETPLPLASSGLVHGRTLQDLISHRAIHGNITLTAEFRSGSTRINLKVVVQSVVTGAGAAVRQVVKSWILRSDDLSLNLERTGLDPGDSTYELSGLPGTDETTPVSWRGLRPDLSKFGEATERVESILDDLVSWARSVSYLKSPRSLPSSPFSFPGEQWATANLDGMQTAYLLADSDTLRAKVREWYREHFGVTVDLRMQGDVAFLEIRDPRMSTTISMDQAGQGLAQVLPVAVQALSAEERGPGIDLIEHPEAELHPGAHGAVADLLLESLAGRNRPLLVETHSEMLLLRARRRVVEGKLPPEDLAIYWIDISEEGLASARRIHVTEDGEVEGWPDGVFYEDYDEILAIRRMAHERIA